MRTTGVGPHIRESDLFSGALLEQKSVFRVKQKDTESTMQKSIVYVFNEMTFFFLTA
jgi:hypothetical protein